MQSASGERPAVETVGDAPAGMPPAPPRSPSPAAEAAPSAESPAAKEASARTPPPVPAEQQWHVRAASGEQYGPADAATFKQWIAEGRVAADSWVWRTGWSDWQPGSVALEAFAEGPPQQGASLLAAADAKEREPAEGRPLSAAEQRRRKLARRRRRTVQVTVGLIILTAILAAVLVVVLLR